MSLFKQNEFLSIEMMKHFDTASIRTLMSMPEYQNLFTPKLMADLFKTKLKMLGLREEQIRDIEKIKNELNWFDVYNLVEISSGDDTTLMESALREIFNNDDLEALQIMLYINSSILNTRKMLPFGNFLRFDTIIFDNQNLFPRKILKYLIQKDPYNLGYSALLKLTRSNDYNYIKSVLDPLFETLSQQQILDLFTTGAIVRKGKSKAYYQYIITKGVPLGRKELGDFIEMIRPEELPLMITNHYHIPTAFSRVNRIDTDAIAYFKQANLGPIHISKYLAIEDTTTFQIEYKGDIEKIPNSDLVENLPLLQDDSPLFGLCSSGMFVKLMHIVIFRENLRLTPLYWYLSMAQRTLLERFIKNAILRDKNRIINSYAGMNAPEIISRVNSFADEMMEAVDQPPRFANIQQEFDRGVFILGNGDRVSILNPNVLTYPQISSLYAQVVIEQQNQDILNTINQPEVHEEYIEQLIQIDMAAKALRSGRANRTNDDDDNE
ncbi:MAG: hypothetical protein Solivirus5_5 [Solivirus sp.]|uniref:Uncharacterized protein n=1 Tax=Solivirus sp. TaxID=2487772 RepID=A0A3G5AFX5_9VIRU|nr:MAG: hypothetical protein Solivirus5_5 [Solivirus sp.]